MILNISQLKQERTKNSAEKKEKGWRTAYDELFHRNTGAETFWDITSIMLSVLFWVFIAVYISWPFAKVTAYKLQHLDQYEFALPIKQPSSSVR